MCTAINFEGLFGRTLDVENGYGEQIVLAPKNYPFKLRNGTILNQHFAVLGMAAVNEKVPLYFDAVNEKGLAAAGLNFPEFAVYNQRRQGKFNLASFELISYVLATCDSVVRAKTVLQNINITNENFSAQMPTTPLHFIFADKWESITVEPVDEGLKVYQNETGVLTNAPTFLEHLENLEKYNTIPGDTSSTSRFVRVAHFKKTAKKEQSVAQFFSVLGTVNRPREENERQHTLYTSCIDLEKGNYLVKAYDGGLSAVEINKEDLNGEKLLAWQYEEKPQINKLN